MYNQLQSLMLRLRSAEGVDAPIVRWGVLLIISIILWNLLLIPYLEWREQKIEMVQMQVSKVERLRALSSVADQWQAAEVAFSNEAKKLAPLFFQASSYAVAQTDLLTLVHQYLGRFHLIIDSQRLLDAELVSGLGESVGLDLRMHGKLVDILAFVDALSHDSHLLNIDSLYIAKQGDDGAVLQVGLKGYRQLIDEVRVL